MNKTVFPLIVGLLVVGSATYAMENDVSSVCEKIAQQVPETIKPIVDKVCPMCMSYKNILDFCKKHPVYLAAGAAASVVIVICNIPAVKNKIDTWLGIKPTKQVENIAEEIHSLPQEKVEESNQA